MSATNVGPTGPPVSDQSSGGRRGGIKSRGGVDPFEGVEQPQAPAGRGPGPSGRGRAPAPAAPVPATSVFEEPGPGFQRPMSPYDQLAQRAHPRDPDLLLRQLAAKYDNPDIVRLLNSVDNA